MAISIPPKDSQRETVRLLWRLGSSLIRARSCLGVPGERPRKASNPRGAAAGREPRERPRPARVSLTRLTSELWPSNTSARTLFRFSRVHHARPMGQREMGMGDAPVRSRPWVEHAPAMCAPLTPSLDGPVDPVPALGATGEPRHHAPL